MFYGIDLLCPECPDSFHYVEVLSVNLIIPITTSLMCKNIPGSFCSARVMQGTFSSMGSRRERKMFAPDFDARKTNRAEL